tara:strand:+ start:1854 stop:2402 length:549 start_codon:yes stop_codon:yes gene_type:complete
MKMIKTHEFRTAVYEGHISFNQKKVLKILKSADHIIQPDVYMKTSFFKEKNILLYKDFKFLLDKCGLFFNYVAQQEKYKKLKVVASWFQIYQKGDFHQTHVHNTSSLTHKSWNFIFYIDCPKHSSKTIILEPGYPYIDQASPVAITPTVGGCVAFPGYIPHFVEPNKSSKRIILSCNVDFIL